MATSTHVVFQKSLFLNSKEMRRHRSFEFLASEYLREMGYTTEVTQAVADWGVDVFCWKDKKKYAVQAKMYGDCKTSITRRMMMELYGVMHYFDCQGAIMIYNGHIMEDAVKVADKLGIELIYLDQHLMNEEIEVEDLQKDVFESIWSDIRQLQGNRINNSTGKSYQIINVSDGEIVYVNEAGKRHRESRDLFKRIVAHIQRFGYIEQTQLRGEFDTRASAFISTVFANIPSCEVSPVPRRIVIRPQ